MGMVTVAAATAAVIDVSVSAVSSLGQCDGNLGKCGGDGFDGGGGDVGGEGDEKVVMAGLEKVMTVVARPTVALAVVA